MALKTRPRLADSTIEKWIDDRADRLDKANPEKAPHLRGAQFISMVGDDPDNPKVDKANLMRAFDLRSRGAIYRWLAQLRRERGK